MSLALINAINSKITPFFPFKSCLFLSQWHCFTKRQQPIRFQSFVKITNQIRGKWRTTFQLCRNQLSIGAVKYLHRPKHPVFEWLNFFLFQNGCSNKVIIAQHEVQLPLFILVYVISDSCDNVRRNSMLITPKGQRLIFLKIHFLPAGFLFSLNNSMRKFVLIWWILSSVGCWNRPVLILNILNVLFFFSNVKSMAGKRSRKENQNSSPSFRT